MSLLKKYQEVLAYLFFGVLTTLVNYLVYFLCLKTFGWDFRLSNFLAWFFSVLFAFITNKWWVFRSATPEKKAFLTEAGLFYFYRLISLVWDMLLMIVLISGLHLGDFWAKTITQVTVVLLNYVFSKWFIFKKRGEK